MKIIITDTNVFFDIIKIKALPEFFALDIEIATTDFVEREILLSDQKDQIALLKRSRKLTIIQLSAEDVIEVKKFKTKRIFKTLPDKTVLWKAKQLNCPLLTGDGKLRNEALEQGLKVYGSIWVIKNLVDKEIVNAKKGVDFLEALKTVNDRLPFDEIEKLIKKWRK